MFICLFRESDSPHALSELFREREQLKNTSARDAVSPLTDEKIIVVARETIQTNALGSGVCLCFFTPTLCKPVCTMHTNVCCERFDNNFVKKKHLLLPYTHVHCLICNVYASFSVRPRKGEPESEPANCFSTDSELSGGTKRSCAHLNLFASVAALYVIRVIKPVETLSFPRECCFCCCC